MLISKKRNWQNATAASLLVPMLMLGAPLSVSAQEDAEPNLPAEDQDIPEPPAPVPAPGPSDTSAPPPPPPPPAPTNNAPTGNAPTGAGNRPGAPAAGANPPASGRPATVPSAGTGTNRPSAAPGTAVVNVPPKGSSAVPAGQELVNIDFPEPTEIKDIIKAVALWTGKNVILDRNVNGKVQIISPRKVTKEEAYQAFLSALNLLGLTTVETGKVIKIMPVRTAVKGNLRTFLGSSWTPLTDEIITQIVPLKYIDAKEIQSTLSRIVSSNAMIAYQPTNTLIISDSGFKVRRVLDIIELLDVPGQQAQVAIVPIRYAEAKNIADKVSEIFKSTSSAKPGSQRSSYSSYKIMTDERTNSVIIFGPPRTISDVKALVQKFDVPLDDPSKQATIHVRPLEYADAKKLASTLQALATGRSANRTTPRRVPPLGPGMQPQSTAPLSVADLGDDVKIAPDESSNALLITGSAQAYQTVNSLIRKLDMRRSQVFVEADILDINMNGGFKFGTSIFAGQGRADGKGTAVATTWQAGKLGPLVAAQATSATSTSAAGAEKVAGVFAEDLTVGILSGKDVNIPGLGKIRPGALITMIKADANTRILSSPHLLTSNNEEAKITVGEKIFFRSSEVQPQTGAVVNKVEKEDVDLTLSVKPNISHSNYITLNVDLESSSVNIDNTTQLPKVNKRKTKQIVTVKNGQTVVISGLVQNAEYQSFKKIPLLGDIPIIGWLFRNSDINHVRNNLMIFLTPHVIHGADDLSAVYQAKVEERDQFLASIYGSGYKNDDFYALLPTAEDGKYTPDETDRVEKERQDELQRELYGRPTNQQQGQTEENNGAANKSDAVPGNNKNVKESDVYVPLSPGDGNGGDMGGASSISPGGVPPPVPDVMDGGGPEPVEPPPPPPPPPEPSEPPPPPEID